MHVRSHHALRTTLVAGLVLFSTRPAHAQALAPHAPHADVAAPNRPALGPTTEAASVAVRPVETRELQLNAAAAPRKGYGQPVALMVVGGAAVLTGLIIGNDVGTVIAVGGAVMGLYGLYEYLQ
jgi:hypothetical protein